MVRQALANTFSPIWMIAVERGGQYGHMQPLDVVLGDGGLNFGLIEFGNLFVLHSWLLQAV